MVHRLEITLSDELWDRLNEARGFEPRASFVKRALESALATEDGGGSPGVSQAVLPAPSRAPVEKEPEQSVRSAECLDRKPSAGSTPASSAPSRPAHLQNFQRAGKLR